MIAQFTCGRKAKTATKSPFSKIIIWIRAEGGLSEIESVTLNRNGIINFFLDT